MMVNIAIGFTGDGTAYNLDSVPDGNCNLLSSAESVKRNYAALNTPQWNGLKHCGQCAQVRCIDKRCKSRRTAIVQIVDRCPECKFGDLDLSPQVFTEITGSAPSRLKVSWEFVACPNSIAMPQPEFCLKPGSNGYWMAVQPLNFPSNVQSMKINGRSAVLDPNQVDSYYFVGNGMGGVNLNAPVEIQVVTETGATTSRITFGKDGNCVLDTNTELSRRGRRNPKASLPNSRGRSERNQPTLPSVIMPLAPDTPQPATSIPNNIKQASPPSASVGSIPIATPNKAQNPPIAIQLPSVAKDISNAASSATHTETNPEKTENSNSILAPLIIVLSVGSICALLGFVLVRRRNNRDSTKDYRFSHSTDNIVMPGGDVI